MDQGFVSRSDASNRHKYIISILLAFTLCAFTLFPGLAQQWKKTATEQDEGVMAFDIIVNLILLNVKVTDEYGRPVYDLDKDAFTIYEDEVEQQLTYFERRGPGAVSLGILVDTSDAMADHIWLASKAASDLIEQMSDKDEAFLMQLDAERQMLQPFTGDKREIQNKVSGLTAGGEASLSSAIIASADYAQKRGERERKAIVVFTGGKRKIKQTAVIGKLLAENAAKVYIIAINSSPKRKKSLARHARGFRGNIFFADSVDEMTEIVGQIAEELQAHYIIAYYPRIDIFDGKYHSIRVTAQSEDNRQLTIHTRKGYYAASP